MKKTILTLTPGDPDGIGPEITWKAIQGLWRKNERIALLCVGAKAPFEKLGVPLVEVRAQGKSKTLDLDPPPLKGPHIWLLPAPETQPPGKLLQGFQAGWSIQRATELVLGGHAAALITGPIHKERLQQGGYFYPGHTEFLAKLSQTKAVTMMLANDRLRVSLVTTHLALRDVPKALTREKIRRAVTHTAEGLRNFWGIQRPKIAVAALNPHAGESGLFGREEIEVIEPEIRALERRGGRSFQIFGPLPADTLFATQVLPNAKNRYDAVVCMYHDQGLIPVKLLDFPNTVNVTLGLPMIRTSVDHGVAFDIAGRGMADPSSLTAAIRLAVQFTKKRRR